MKTELKKKNSIQKGKTMNFEFKNLAINKIELDIAAETDISADYYCLNAGARVKGIIIDGQSYHPSKRFWESLYARFSMNKSFFYFFTPDEVFNRIAEVDPSGMVRVCIEHKNTGAPQLLAATGLNKPVIVYDDLLELLDKFGVDEEHVEYDNGIVTSTHTPRVKSDFEIAGDDFSNRFSLQCPIDGYGNPNVYISLLRLVCSNGMIGYSKAFKTALSLGSGGDNVLYTLSRTLDSFNSDEGYAMMRDRFQAAANSYASIREQRSLYKTLLEIQNDPKLKETVGDGNASAGQVMMKRYEDMTGRPEEMYKTDANLLTSRKQRVLPVDCRVYDMMNFATELATHNVTPRTGRALQAWVGEMLSSEYDLEDSYESFDQFQDFFVNEEKKGEDE